LSIIELAGVRPNRASNCPVALLNASRSNARYPTLLSPEAAVRQL